MLLSLELVVWLILSLIILSFPLTYVLKKIRNIGKKTKWSRKNAYKDFQEREAKRENEKKEKLSKASSRGLFEEESTIAKKLKERKETINKEKGKRENKNNDRINDNKKPEDKDKKKASKKDLRNTPERTIIKEISREEKTIINDAKRLKEKDKKLYEKKLNEGLAINPKNNEILAMLADHYFDKQHNKKAMTLLKRLLDQDQKNHRALWQMGEIYIQNGEHKTAELIIEKAIKLQKDNPRYLYSMVDIKYNTDKIQEAIYLMERILKLRPKNVEYLIAIAMLYEQMDDIQAAKRYYFAVSESDPNNPIAKKRLKQL